MPPTTEPGFSNVTPGSPAAPLDSPEIIRDRAERAARAAYEAELAKDPNAPAE